MHGGSFVAGIVVGIVGLYVYHRWVSPVPGKNG